MTREGRRRLHRWSGRDEKYVIQATCEAVERRVVLGRIGHYWVNAPAHVSELTGLSSQNPSWRLEGRAVFPSSHKNPGGSVLQRYSRGDAGGLASNRSLQWIFGPTLLVGVEESLVEPVGDQVKVIRAKGTWSRIVCWRRSTSWGVWAVPLREGRASVCTAGAWIPSPSALSRVQKE